MGHSAGKHGASAAAPGIAPEIIQLVDMLCSPIGKDAIVRGPTDRGRTEAFSFL